MAFVPGYKYDIFISYAHLDNQHMFDKGWVEIFHKSLEWFLGERTGKLGEIKIWWDNKKLDGNKLFDATIQEGINESAIMISLVSRFYLQSEYCKLEMDLFSEKVEKEKAGLRVGDRSRLVHVLLQNIPYTEWPSHFAGRTGFPFYSTPDKQKLGDTIRSSSPEFISQMGVLRDAIEELLKEFRQSGQDDSPGLSNSNAPVEKNKEAFTIFFAEVPDTLQSTRKRAMAALEKKGYTVITPGYSNSVTEHTEEIKQSLSASDLSIHLLDLYPGREFPGEPGNWYPLLEVESALRHAPASFIWTPKLVMENVEEADYKKFLESLGKGSHSSETTELVHDSKSHVIQLILDHADQLKVLKQAKYVKEKISLSETVQVLIDTTVEDQVSAWELGKALLENGIQPIVNPGDADPVKNLHLLADRMSQAQKLIFYYGKADKDWIRQRMNAALHLAMEKQLPVDDFFIYMAPPMKDPASVLPRQKFVKINLIDSASQSGEQAITQLVKHIKGQPL